MVVTKRGKGYYGEAGPAILSPDRVYRYTLERVWDERPRRVAFIGLNPSTADETQLDNTLRRCVRFADGWGFGGFVMLNLFAFRSTTPRLLWAVGDPVGKDNNRYIIDTLQRPEVDLIVACWGVHGALLDRCIKVREMIEIGLSYDLHHMGLTKDGHPRHPLYLPSTTQPEVWTS